MKVQFEFSAGDLAEVANRASDRSRVVRDWRFESRLTWAVLVGILVYAVTPGQPAGRAVFAALIGLLLVVVIPRLNRVSSRNCVFRRRRTADPVMTDSIGAKRRKPVA